MSIKTLFFIPQKTKYKFDLKDTDLDPPKFMLANKNLEELYLKKVLKIMNPGEEGFNTKDWATIFSLMSLITAGEYPVQITSSASRRDSATITHVLNRVFNDNYKTIKYVYEAYLSARMASRRKGK